MQISQLIEIQENLIKKLNKIESTNTKLQENLIKANKERVVLSQPTSLGLLVNKEEITNEISKEILIKENEMLKSQLAESRNNLSLILEEENQQMSKFLDENLDEFLSKPEDVVANINVGNEEGVENNNIPNKYIQHNYEMKRMESEVNTFKPSLLEVDSLKKNTINNINNTFKRNKPSNSNNNLSRIIPTTTTTTNNQNIPNTNTNNANILQGNIINNKQSYTSADDRLQTDKIEINVRDISKIEENEKLLIDQLIKIKSELKDTRVKVENYKKKYESSITLQDGKKSEILSMLNSAIEKLILEISITPKLKELIIVILKMLDYNESEINNLINKSIERSKLKNKKGLLNIFK